MSLLAAGDYDIALRAALPLCERDASSAIAWFVVGTAVGQANTELAERALRFAAKAAVHSAHLPLAIAAAVSLRPLGIEPAQLLSQIASAYGRGSPQLAERRAAPPALPRPVDRQEPLGQEQEESGEALRKHIEGLLTSAEAALTPDKPKSLSPHPLFSALPASELAEFASIFEVLILPEQRRVVEEGNLGAEAYVVARGELEVEKQGSSPGAPSVHLARLSAGALFGEMALLSRSPRAASVTTMLPSVLLVGNKEALDRVAAHAPVVAHVFAEHCKRRMLENLMRTSPLFRSASAAERPALIERFVIRTFEPGDRVASQGKASEGLYLIASGQVQIVHGEGDERTIVTELGAGDVVGEVALILRRSAIANAVASHPTVSLFLPAARFLDLVRAHPRVFADLYRLAVSRDEEIQSISQEETLEGEDFVLV